MRLSLIVAGTLTTAVLAACGTAGDTDTPAEGAGGPDGFPMTFENCGTEITLDEPVERVFSWNQEMTETLLSLRLGDQMSGTGQWNEDVMESLADENAKVDSVGRDSVSLEAVLDVEPDLLAASWDPFSESDLGSREDFDKLGIPVYVSPTECVGKERTGDSDSSERDGLLDVTIFYDEIEELARMAGHPERGTDLVADLERRVADASGPDYEGTSVLFWYADSEMPYVAGCCGASGFIADALGLTNVFADTKKDWPQVSWEVVAERNPDVLVIPDLDRGGVKSADSGAAKIEFLESNPVTAEMDAVRNKRYILVRGTTLTPSVAMIYGIEEIAEDLDRLGLGAGTS